MLKLKTLLRFLVVMLLTFSASSFAASDFYWKNSYGRGAGTAQTLSCGSNDLDGGLCYEPCSKGTGIGPVCWDGPIPKGRGAGKPASLGCGGKEYDAGLCYEKCRSGYKGVGPICWGLPPSGYIECGAGFAKDQAVCGLVTASQSTSIAMVGVATMPAATIAANRIKQSQAGRAVVEAAEKVAKTVEPLMVKLRPLFEAGAKNPSRMATIMADVSADAARFFAANKEQIKAAFQGYRMAKGTGSATIQAQNDDMDPIEGLRFIATILSIFDETPITGFISSFCYPVYNPGTSPARAPVAASPTQAPPQVVNSWSYLYGIQANGDLWAFRLDAGGQFGFSGRIGQGWGGMKSVSAGNTGELFAVATNGDLYYYQHDEKLGWRVAGKKIGTGWGAMKWVLSVGNHGNQRVIFALNEKNELIDYRFEGPDMRNVSAKTIGWGWGGYQKVFGGPNGMVYAINDKGELVMFQYNLANTQKTPSPKAVGPGWNNYSQVFAGTNGNVFGVDANARLFAYRDVGGGNFVGPQQIGTGFGLLRLTAMKQW